MSSFDSIVIGAGHNGLACAFDLAKAGRKVLVLESAPRAGGAAVTREFATGFKVSACAHLLFAFPGQLMRDMQLERHGLRLAGRDLPTLPSATAARCGASTRARPADRASLRPIPPRTQPCASDWPATPRSCKACSA
jgi:phytoene dehydrogenase-like protein